MPYDISKFRKKAPKTATQALSDIKANVTANKAAATSKIKNTPTANKIKARAKTMTNQMTKGGGGHPSANNVLNAKSMVKRIKANTKMPGMKTSTVGGAMDKAASITGMKLPTGLGQLKKTTRTTSANSVKSKARKVIANYKKTRMGK